jgi:hypothetical protein
MTVNRGYLLTWLFAAPHEAELRELLRAKVGFAAEPGATAPSAAAKGPASANPARPPIEAAPAASQQPNTATNRDSTPQSYPRPSLLRDGETAETAQKAGQSSNPTPK